MQQRRSTMSRIGIGAGLGIGIGIVALVGAVVVGGRLLNDEPETQISLARPVAGEVRADYFPDGTPVWVIGHRDGTIDVLSGFDTHVPSNLGKLNWWCPDAFAIENPAHGSRWDEYGVKLGGPAPAGLPSWEVRVEGSRIFIGEPRPAPPIAAQPGPPLDRDWCATPEDDVIYHTFDGWKVWDSPTAAVQDASSDWVLLEGDLVLAPEDNRVRLCAVGDCADSVIASNVETPVSLDQFGPLGTGRFIAHVHNGALVDLTQVVFLDGLAP